MGLKIIDGTPSSISKFIKEKEEIELRKQGAVDVLEELHMDIYAMAWNKKDVLKLIIKRIKELKECERINE